MLDFNSKRIIEEVFYIWACGEVSNDVFKARLALHGYTADLRQADNGNTLEIVGERSGIMEVIAC